jgi:transposase
LHLKCNQAYSKSFQTGKLTIEYSVEFKIKVIKLTFELDVKAIDIAKVFNLHPMMIYRWRQEYREGKFVEEPSRRISMTKDRELTQ